MLSQLVFKSPLITINNSYYTMLLTLLPVDSIQYDAAPNDINDNIITTIYKSTDVRTSLMSVVISWPAIAAVPFDGLISPVNMLNVVVLPAPGV